MNGNIKQDIYVFLLTLEIESEFSHSGKCSFNKDLLKKLDQSFGERILYFLFKKIDCKLAQSTFRECWPISDLRMRAQFQKNCFDWYKSLYQSGCYALKPRPVVSRDIFNPCCDKEEKFVETIYTLCLIAAQRLIKSIDSLFPILSLPKIKVKGDIAKGVNAICMQKQWHCRHYLNFVPKRVQLMSLIDNLAKLLVEQYQDIASQISQCKAEISSRLTKSQLLDENSLHSDSFLQKLENAIEEKNNEIEKLWTKLALFKDIDEEFWSKTSLLVDNDKDISCLAGRLISIEANKGDMNQWSTEGKLDLPKILGNFRSSFKEFRRNAGEKREANSECMVGLQNQGACVEGLKNGREALSLRLKDLSSKLVLNPFSLSNPYLSDAASSDSSDKMFSTNLDSFTLCSPAFYFKKKRSFSSNTQSASYKFIDLSDVSLNADFEKLNFKGPNLLRSPLSLKCPTSSKKTSHANNSYDKRLRFPLPNEPRSLLDSFESEIQFKEVIRSFEVSENLTSHKPSFTKQLNEETIFSKSSHLEISETELRSNSSTFSLVPLDGISLPKTDEMDAYQSFSDNLTILESYLGSF